MNSTRIKSIAIFLIAGLALYACQPTQLNKTPEPHPLIGSWEMTSIHWITADTTYSIQEAQPSLFMIDTTRYAIMWTPQDEPRTPFENLSQPTPEEMQAGFRSVVFNGGSHTMTDSTLTTTAYIAKVPGFEGGKQFYNYTAENDQLTLVMFDETYPDGTKPSWYGKYQTKFILKRAK
ncbi:MAG: hypothetical protein ABJH98_12065 [Reichenbachiella sp.]|uniref:hypothetical protein n=1 Tax=Reichenbachiella sp. TaxID=2184521 RepID=UPI00329752AD